MTGSGPGLAMRRGRWRTVPGARKFGGAGGPGPTEHRLGVEFEVSSGGTIQQAEQLNIAHLAMPQSTATVFIKHNGCNGSVSVPPFLLRLLLE